MSQTTPGYSQKAADWYTYDPDKANELLDDAGWTELDADGVRTKDGDPLTVVLPYGAGSIINADGAAILQGVKEQASQVGFDVDLIPVPQSELFSGAYSQPDERDINVGYWTAVTAGILYINWRPSTEEKPELQQQCVLQRPGARGHHPRGQLRAATSTSRTTLYGAGAGVHRRARALDRRLRPAEHARGLARRCRASGRSTHRADRRSMTRTSSSRGATAQRSATAADAPADRAARRIARKVAAPSWCSGAPPPSRSSRSSRCRATGRRSS